MTERPKGRKNPHPPARKLRLTKAAIAALPARMSGYLAAGTPMAPGSACGSCRPAGARGSGRAGAPRSRSAAPT